MKNTLPCFAIAAGMFLTPSAVQADLPGLKKQPWIGYFIGIEQKKKMRFGLTAKGQGIISVLNQKNEPIYSNHPSNIDFNIVETLPDGKLVRKQINSDTLTSDQPASQDPKSPITFRGKVTGDAAFEVTVSPERDGIAFSGKITDKGTLTNPLHFEISVNFSPYPNTSKNNAAQLKALETFAAKDFFQYETVSRKRNKIEFLDKVNPVTTVGEPISRLEFKTAGFDDNKFGIQTTDKAKLTFEDAGIKPLWQGFTLLWRVDEGANAATQKLTITAK